MKRGSPKEDERVTKSGSQETQEEHFLTICPSQLHTELKISPCVFDIANGKNKDTVVQYFANLQF